MKRLLFVFLMMTCSVSWAEWEFFEDSDGLSIFIEKNSIKRKSGIAQMFVMRSYAEEQKAGQFKFFSMVSLDIFDCVDDLTGVKNYTLYSKQYAQGKALTSIERDNKELELKGILPGTHGNNLWKIACGKK